MRATAQKGVMLIAAAMAAMAPLAQATKDILDFKPLRTRKIANRYGAEVRAHRTSSRAAAMDRRDAVKRRNVLRNRRAHA